MTLLESRPMVGASVDRVDAPLKVTGTADYPNDVSYPDLAHAAVVGSTIAAGRITGIDTACAEAAPGVLAVLTHHNSPRLSRKPATVLGPQPPAPLQDDRILYHGQYVALVVAATAEQATAAAELIDVDYAADPAPVLSLDDPRAERQDNPWGFDAGRGDVGAGLAAAEVRIEQTYTTPAQTNNPLGLFTTVAHWDGDALTVHDCTQHPAGARAALAGAFDIDEERVRVLARYVGGGFGAGLRAWPHGTLAALAARVTGRPVRLELTRPQMFTGVGYRPPTVQRLRIGATRDGRLVAIDHRGLFPTAMEDGVRQRFASRVLTAYACPNVVANDQQVRLNIGSPAHMRAPGTAEANFALESALDELAYRIGIDPIELRLRNYTGADPQAGRDWSSTALRECYRLGAERFGWYGRSPAPGSMRDGRWLIGYGMAGVTFGWSQAPCQASATVRRDGTAIVASSATDIGTGTYTVMAQLSADLLGLRLGRVRFDLGDTMLPRAPQEGGSGLAVSLGSAVHAACKALIQSFLDLVRDDPDSPLRGCRPEDVTVHEGRVHRVGAPAQGQSYADMLARHGRDELTAAGASAPPGEPAPGLSPAGAFAAKFVEVRIDADLGELRVARVVSAVDGGRILNPKLAASQIAGGTVGGIGMALLERTVADADTGRVANANLADYLVPVQADVPDLEVLFTGDPDPMNPVGVKGVGEVGLVGIAPAIANAVHHATGRRIRSLPITVEDLL